MKSAKAWIPSITVALIAGTSCALADDREAKGRAFLEQRITAESQGLIRLKSFRKTNGYSQEAMGTQMYVLEWQAEASIEASIWKAGNNLIGYWDSFAATTEKPSRMNSLMTASSPRRFLKGSVIGFFGESLLRKTDNGWRVESLRVKRSNVTPPPDAPSEGRSTDFVAFFREFKAAVRTGEKQALAKFMMFPGGSDLMPAKTEAEFLKGSFPFEAELAKGIVNSEAARSHEDGTYSLAVGMFALYFRKDGDGHWKWSDFYVGERG